MIRRLVRLGLTFASADGHRGAITPGYALIETKRAAGISHADAVLRRLGQTTAGQPQQIMHRHRAARRARRDEPLATRAATPLPARKRRTPAATRAEHLVLTTQAGLPHRRAPIGSPSLHSTPVDQGWFQGGSPSTGDAVLAELLAQVADVHVDDVGGGVEVIAPHLAEQLLACEDLAGVAKERFGEREFAGAEVDRAAGDVHLAGAQVQCGVAGVQQRLFGGVWCAQADANAREELFEAKRFVM